MIMDITQENRDQIKKWVEEGRSLAQIQKDMLDDMGISMTYMDVRFLVDDLGLELAKEEEPEVNQEEKSDEATLEAQGEALLEEEGRVSVDLDTVVRPGAVVSGTVLFSDGVRAQWQLDTMGQLGLIPSQEGYRPNSEDVDAFQIELRNVLQKAGF